MKDESYTSEDTEGMTTRHEEQADSTREAPADTTRAQEETGSTRHHEEETGSTRHHEAPHEAPATGYPTLEHFDDWVFEVEGTVLKKYYGAGPVVQIPYGVTEIGEDAFADVEQVSSSAKLYHNRDDLQEITIPASVTLIGANAFSACIALKKITMPAGVTKIGDYAFWGCNSLEKITIPACVTSIGKDAFWHCESLKEITIPASVTSIGEHAFWHCESLEKITVDPANRAYRGIGNCLIEFKSRTLVAGCKTSVIPMGVKAIGQYAFYGCKSLEKISISKSVTSIGKSAFFCCKSLQEITLPAGVTSIGGDAFYGCFALTIYCETKKQPEGWDEKWNSSNRPVVWGKK